MKIVAEPIWNNAEKTATLQLTDEQWEHMKQAEFKGKWHLLRYINSGE